MALKYTGGRRKFNGKPYALALLAFAVLFSAAMGIIASFSERQPITKTFTVCAVKATPDTGSGTYRLLVADAKQHNREVNLLVNPATNAASQDGLFAVGTTTDFTFRYSETWQDSTGAILKSAKRASTQRPGDCGVKNN